MDFAISQMDEYVPITIAYIKKANGNNKNNKGNHFQAEANPWKIFFIGAGVAVGLMIACHFSRVIPLSSEELEYPEFAPVLFLKSYGHTPFVC